MTKKETRHKVAQERMQKALMDWKMPHGDITGSCNNRKFEVKKIDREVLNKPLWNKPQFILYKKDE